MSIMQSLQNQFRSVIQWDDPREWEMFRKFTDKGDELKNASKLIIQPGQGCIFTHEGKIEGVFDEAGLYDLQTGNAPFITTLKKVLNAFESEHKTALWFFRKADTVNIRWGTRIPITYNDPVYGFPVSLRGFGNYSIRITEPAAFFARIVSGQENYYAHDLQELFLSRISQPIAAYLANARFSYAEIDAHIEQIAKDAREKTTGVFEELGFALLDFRIEGNSFDEATNQRIAGISDVQADAKAAQLAGVNFSELQQLKAMRDAAKNEGTAGAGMGMLTGINLGNTMQQPNTPETDIKAKLGKLKELFDEGLIDEAEYKEKKKDLLGNW
ncbi:SPFH domain-containing protein [Chitinophaga lutea]|uniref:SPFH domain-containing protein n=1 Tax=Chitinophaga lutea TaxID=2488634 RepID=A0A3N4PKB4_9BACT|nr:SPFH domain-containing protein [Chitinophaga lutea]RPE08255.1 SPFH domain-containing protein [Chitinophaga lutea]